MPFVPKPPSGTIGTNEFAQKMRPNPTASIFMVRGWASGP
jgi:hypothetical protein